jgi:predicted type IV restriction endonuclease
LSINGRATAASGLGCLVLPLVETESPMETAEECYRHAVRCDHLAEFALSEKDRDVMLAAAVNWRKLAGSAEEAEKAAKPE